MTNARISLVLMAVVFLVTGCNGIQVVDNTYGPMGGQYVNISGDLSYLGNPDVYAPGNCVGDCPVVIGNNIKTRSDVFASKVDGNLSEICVIERRMLIGNFSWRAMDGREVQFGGKTYSEEFFAITEQENGGYINAYVNYLVNQGYGFDIKGMVFRILARNINKTNKILLIYGCDIDTLPESFRGDEAKTEEYLREKFDTRFTLSQD